ncbi:MAG: DUF1844 domain-containing protein [Proteobacteria bacterium]|nr:DUF1844 domain-containing protein [Pseudomonadota bacterium]
MADKSCKSNPMEGVPLEVNFSTFLMSLSSSALMALGETPDPTTGETVYMPHLAKHTIDIIAMLQNKIKNGLEDKEAKLMCDLLYDLRMRYVNKSK